MCTQITRSRYDCWKEVLSRRGNVESDGAETTSLCSAFHIRGAEKVKVRLTTVDSLNDGGTTRRLVLAERSVRRPGRSTRLLGPVVRGSAAQCRALQNLVSQHGDFVLNTFRHSQPIKTDQGVANVVGVFQLIGYNEPCWRVQHRLQTAYQVGWNANHNTITKVMP